MFICVLWPDISFYYVSCFRLYLTYSTTMWIRINARFGQGMGIATPKKAERHMNTCNGTSMGDSIVGGWNRYGKVVISILVCHSIEDISIVFFCCFLFFCLPHNGVIIITATLPLFAKFFVSSFRIDIILRKYSTNGLSIASRMTFMSFRKIYSDSEGHSKPKQNDVFPNSNKKISL